MVSPESRFFATFFGEAKKVGPAGRRTHVWKCERRKRAQARDKKSISYQHHKIYGSKSKNSARQWRVAQKHNITLTSIFFYVIIYLNK